MKKEDMGQIKGPKKNMEGHMLSVLIEKGQEGWVDNSQGW